jgi:transcriptional regulator with XRE-family HTH domain
VSATIEARTYRSRQIYCCLDMLRLVDTTRAGALIATARLKRRLTQARLADLAGTTQPTISAYERGTKVPDLATLERILRAAGFELRMSLAAHDDHDESLDRYERTLPTATRRRFADRQRSRKAAASG